MDQSVQVKAFLRIASKRGKEWLETLHEDAALAVAAGDVEITTTSFEGGSAGGARKFNAQELLELTELCLQELEGTAEPKVLTTDYSRRRVEA